MQEEADLWSSLLRDALTAGSFHKPKGKLGKLWAQEVNWEL